MQSIKSALLIAFVFLAPACVGTVMPDDAEPAMCERLPLVSTYIVDCGDGTGVCRGASGEVLYLDCMLNYGTSERPELIECVDSCGQ